MITFNDMNKFASVQDFTADVVRELIGDYCVRGKAIDAEKEDPMKLFNRVDWIVNRVGRVLDVTGKLDATTTSFRIDRDTDNILHVRFVDGADKTVYALALGEKGKVGKDEFEYILRDENGNEVVRDKKWKAIAEFFAPPAVKKAKSERITRKSEVALKQAAAPKKEKRVKAVKNPVPVAAPESDPVAEADAVLQDEMPPAELG